MLTIGKPAPLFENVTAFQKGKEEFISVSLSNYKGKWLIFFFYPRDFTFVCPTEIRGLAKHEEEFKALGAEILGASTDSAWSHKEWFAKDLPEVNYPILADTTLNIARAYGVLDEENGEAQRGLFIIDPEGNLKYVVVTSSSVGRSVKETLRVLKALQSGDLCPVEWEPGQETLGKA